MSEPGALGRAADRAAEPPGVELASLESFVDEHYPRLVRLAGLITRDPDQAQDAVQAALERAWRKHGSIRHAASLRPWLDRIVAREAIRQTRGGLLATLLRRRPVEWAELAAPLPEPVETAVLREALGRLSPDQRAVIALHLHAGYSVDETARVLGVPFDTVRSRLRAARDRLRREMAEVNS
jgi:RNA polymerase sigma-70 factor (ECF subfamily)